MSTKILSKSRLQKGFQCPKNLMLTVFHPELEGEADESQEKLFEDGSKVGELARKEFPEGVLIEGEHSDYEGFVKKTNSAMEGGAKAIFEASFRWKSFFFRADILKKAPKNTWDVIEVKMTNSVKDVHLTDLAIQRVIMEGDGLKVRKTFLMHLNRECQFPDLSDLFVQDDVTDEVEKIVDEVKQKMLSFEKLVAKEKVPETAIGKHCDAPYSCGFKDHCWKHVPSPSIFDIPKLQAWKYYEKNILTIKQLAKEDLSDSVQAFVDSHLKKKRLVRTRDIKAKMAEWEWPLTFLDFETIAYPVPRLHGTSPYNQIPFQFACSVWEKPKSKVVEIDFLDVEVDDPREGIARHLAENLPTEGSVVAYSSSFEAGVLKKLAGMFPHYRRRLLSLAERLVDPLPIIRSAVYDPAFGSSFSLKYVAPALLGKQASYEDMTVGDGGAAQLAYLKIRDADTSAKEKQALTGALIAYCRKDTDLMRQIVAWLYEEIK